jgi:hypothetical protein
MTEPHVSVERVVMTRLIRLNATIQGIVIGGIAGLGLFVVTNWLVIKGGEVVGPHLSLLSQFFIGYSVTFVGSLIGLAYGFALGFAVGYSVAWVYNSITDWRAARRPRA